MFKGIDVSNANGRVDWDKLKSNINYAILRCGYGSDMVSQDDKQWLRNVAECNRLGIPWGVYLYSYAMSTADAESEAAHALRLLKGLKPTYPVYIDMEDADAYKAKRGGISKQVATDICRIFCEHISAAGYTAGVYANKDWAVNRLDMAQLSKWTFWLAQYNSKVTYAGKYDMWQYSSDGSLPGLSTRVDLNYCLKDFTSHNTQPPAVTGLTLDTSSKDMASGEKYTLLAKCKDKPNMDTTGRDVIAVSEPYKDSKGRGWLIDVQGLPPKPVARHAHIKVTADGVTQQCNFNVV
ncbi:glycoside hydrolase family 25 protein [Clostridium merdae]|uniref:glycoside hydrolase family 25 protein n=1 Tax=Clostridium merdae TaxID=1958780 RepID=UPI000A26BFD4|nr:glycoside hydrolase family 25 protein [Clostridium merdae]